MSEEILSFSASDLTSDAECYSMDQILQDDCQTYLGQHREVRGPDAVIGKPIDPATLLRVVDRLATRPFDN